MNLGIHRAHSTADMDVLIFWTCAFILCTQPLMSHSEGTVENAIIDPFDMARGQDDKEWLDPFDMTHYSHGEKKMVNTFGVGFDQCLRREMEKNFLQRMVNLLINHCQTEGAVEDTSILLTVTSNQLNELYRVKDAADSEATIRVLNGIFSSMTVPEESSFIMDIFTSEEIRSNIPAVSFALLPLCIFLTGGTLRRIIIILALAVFAVSYFKTQTFLLKKLEVQNEHTLMMKEAACIPSKSFFFNWYSSKNEEECLKQLQAQKIDPSLEVTPIQVISHMAAVGFLQPMEHFGMMFSRFSKQIFDSHSLLYGLLVFVVGTFIVVYAFSVCFAGIFGRHLSLATRHITLGMTGSAEPQACSERRVEPAAENQAAIKPNTESSVINHGHPPQPVIQIIHNYPMKHMVEPEENINNSKQKSVDSIEESHKICEVIQANSSTKHETSKTSESKDYQKKTSESEDNQT